MSSGDKKKPEDNAESGSGDATWDDINAIGSKDPVISRYAAEVLGLKPTVNVDKGKGGKGI